MRRPSGKTPYPYHLTLSHPEVGTARLLLSADAEGALVTRHRHNGLEAVTPTDYSYGAQSPFTRKTALFSRLVMGMGQPVEEAPGSQRYNHALGMDWSCGLGALATAWSVPFAVGSGPIKGIEHAVIGGVLYLFVLSGDKVFASSASNITAFSDFTQIQDFSVSLPTPPALTATIVNPGGVPATRTIRYCLIWSAPLPISVQQPTPAWPHSAAGPVLTVTGAPNVLDTTNYVELAWVGLPPSGYLPVIMRSLDGGLTWHAISVGASPYQDVSLAMATVSTGGWFPCAPPPATSESQGPYMLHVTAAGGQMRLWVGMDHGGYWYWDGVTWVKAEADGRALASEGFNFLRTSHYGTGSGSSSYSPNNIVAQYELDPSVPGHGVGTTVYSDERSWPLTRIIRLNNTLFTFGEGRIAVGTGPQIFDLTPDRGLPPHPNNGRTAVVWKGDIYSPFGMGLYRIHPTSTTSATLEPIGLERLIENDSPVMGRIVALAPWGPWHLWWALYNEHTLTTSVGKFGAWLNPSQAKDPQSQSVPVLHGALEQWVGRRASWMQHSLAGEPSGNGRLYLGFEDGGLCWTVLSGQGPFAPTDPVCRFRPTGYTILSRHDAGFAADDKTYFDLTAFGTVITNHQRVKFFYVLPDGSEQEIPGAVTEGGEPLVFPSGATAKWVQIKVVMETDDPADSPVIEGVALGEQVRPSLIEEIGFTAHVGPRLIRRDGHVTRASAAELHALLRKLEAKGDDVKVMLPDGEEQRAAITDLTDRYLGGSTTAGPRHDVSLTLLTFRTAS